MRRRPPLLPFPFAAHRAFFRPPEPGDGVYARRAIEEGVLEGAEVRLIEELCALAAEHARLDEYGQGGCQEGG